jgi:hypothetical protein
MEFKIRIYRRISLCLIFFVSCCFLSSKLQQDIKNSPGPLSVFHSESPGLHNCQKCHSQEYAVDDAKCLACHSEIGLRMTSDRGFHRDKKQACSHCHPEHRGKNWNLVNIDIQDFDHSETGCILEGAHQSVKDCNACHRKENSFPRERGRSFILVDSRCNSCHPSPHPGRQDRCQICHNQKNWRVDIWVSFEFR